MKDLANRIAVITSLLPLNRTATANGTGVDLQGFESAVAQIHIGASSDTLSGSVYISAKLQESDDNSTFTDVASSDVTEGSISSGVFYTANSAGTASTVQHIGYIGSKRYIRVSDTRTGTHTNGTPTAAVIIKGNPRHSVDA
jgi:hypothetical protein